MATICLAPAGKARSPQAHFGLNDRAQSLEIPLVSRRPGDTVYDAGRKNWRAPLRRPPGACQVRPLGRFKATKCGPTSTWMWSMSL